jgi:hypothetical protein
MTSSAITHSTTDRPALRLVSCIGTEFDLPLLEFFISHYEALGIEPSRMHFIVHAPDRDRESFEAALSMLKSRAVPEPMQWIGPYTSGEMWRRRRALQQSVSMTGEWVLSADIDEFHEYPTSLDQIISYCASHDFTVVQGPFIDRISNDGSLIPVDPSTPLGAQFPLEAEVMCHIGKIPGKSDAVGTIKLMLFRADVMPGLGGHNPAPAGDVRFASGASLIAFPGVKGPKFRDRMPCKVHHFKWRNSMLQSIEARWRTPGASSAGSDYGKRLYAYLYRSGGRIRLTDVQTFRHAPRIPTTESESNGQRHRKPHMTGKIEPVRSRSPALAVAQCRDPAWEATFRELREQAQTMQEENSSRKPVATASAGWRLRQLTSGTQAGEFHSHSYYDIRVVDSTYTWVAAHRMQFQDRWMTPEDSVLVGTAAIDGSGFEPIGETTAWSWQQGPMAQWIPGTSRMVWNHRLSGDRFGAREYDRLTGETREFELPIYAIDPSGTFALCVDMARLDAMRPGYGYARVSRDAALEPAPSDNGVYRLNLATGDYELILSLERAVECLYRFAPAALCEQVRQLPPAFWFNHVKISPDGNRFTLKLRWRDRDLKVGWNGRMGISLTCGTDGHDLSYLQHATSHVMWWSNSILYYWHELVRSLKFIRDDPAGGIDLAPVMRDIFDQNVHIRHLPEHPFRMVFDLPYRETVELKELDLENGEMAHIASFPNHRPKHGPFRCDLHPVPDESGDHIIATSLQDGGRQIYILERCQ